MCVGAPRPRVPRSALLFLGFVLGTAAQLRCSEHSYPHGDRCCRECQPGEWPGHGVGEGAGGDGGVGMGTQGHAGGVKGVGVAGQVGSG